MKKGWEIKKLGEVAEYFIGLTYSPKNVSDKGIIVLRSSNIQNGLLDLTDLVRVNQLVKDKLIVKEGDILMCSRNGSQRLVGKTATIPKLNEEMTFGTFMTVIRSQYNPFLSWFFISNEFREQITGGSNPMINQITRYMLDDVKLNLPPLPEQQRIISILDETFSSIEQAKENLQRNLQNAKELFQSELNSIFTNKGEGWEETTLKANIELSTGFAFKSKFYTDNEDDILLLRGDNIMQGNFRWQDAKRWNKSEYEDYEKYQLQENDIVLAMDRPWVKAGLKCAKLTKNELPSLLVQRTARLRATSKIDSSFLYHLIRSRGFIAYLLKGQTGLGVPHISGPQILSFIFSKPSIIDQQKIVQQLDKLSTETKRLEAMYQQKLDALEELKKSILQKAFSGELSEN